MKKQLFYLSLLSVVLWNPLADASRSRLTALGQNANGSLYIKDARNMFLNPAQINNVGNQVNMEWGDKDSNVTPKAEGGVVHGMGAMNLGLQLGRVGEASDDAVFGAGSTQANLAIGDYPQDSVEFLFGSEGSMNWGASLLYVNSDTKTSQPASADTEAQIMTAKFGMIADQLQGYVHADITNSLKTETSGVTKEYDGQMTLRLGGSYDLNEVSKLGLRVDRHAYDTNDGAGVKGEGQDLTVQLDWFRVLKQTESDMLYYTFGLSHRDQEFKLNPASTTQTIEKLALPITIGLETKAKDWLVLRGSVTQEVIINKDETKSTAGNTTENNNADDTVVAAGIGFIWNENLTMDATFSGSGSAGNGQFNSTSMFGNVGMNYTF